jgi:hypothetical protein
MNINTMTEEFLHYIWMFKLKKKRLSTIDGNNLVILRAGNRNPDAGPDFLNAMIKIGDTTWAGNVEIHLNASDWFKHGHQEDDTYDNIILHVVYKSDIEVKRHNGERIPCLMLENHADKKLFKIYQDLLNNHLWIPCAQAIYQVNPLILASWLESLAFERLERKSDEIARSLLFNQNDWEQTFFQNLARNMGFRLNQEPFEMLARLTPLVRLARHRDSLFQVEAILFGQAGLLNRKYTEDYPRNLRREYLHLRRKFSFQPIPGHLWKFLRLRPSNFPTVRIAQMASLIHREPCLFSKVIETYELKDARKIFSAGTSEYWDDHYLFDKTSKEKKKYLGNDAIRLLLVNSVIPLLFLYGRMKDLPERKLTAIHFLIELPGENNSITSQFLKFGIRAQNALESQALLELKSQYCDLKRCLNCRIGLDLINETQIFQSDPGRKRKICKSN